MLARFRLPYQAYAEQRMGEIQNWEIAALRIGGAVSGQLLRGELAAVRCTHLARRLDPGLGPRKTQCGELDLGTLCARDCSHIVAA
mmetsp:Transcript_37742/g.90647  ORF Transcript_37742/g.90647 Transcript_37742/m.90647 type:complete len:86 (+) Transcript_37742:348-605(+)